MPLAISSSSLFGIHTDTVNRLHWFPDNDEEYYYYYHALYIDTYTYCGWKPAVGTVGLGSRRCRFIQKSEQRAQ